MPIRTAEAVWEGTSREGKGIVRAEGGGFEGPYSYASRFEDGQGTNPEELLAAAHAACFALALSSRLSKAGTPPRQVRARSNVSIDKVAGDWSVTGIRLEVEADVQGVSPADFDRLAEDAKVNCPISRALKAVPISLEARLAG
ncbi:MAG: peroxiredoxin [Gammaproteobacteria bacterium RBG_16_66_13]|nr:MAG: peroxiredoxin [Gammaproteobacteria bacterium RBG_16_66_13]